MTFAPFYHEAQVTVGDATLRLVINFAALDAVESLTGRGFDRVLAEFTGGDTAPGVPAPEPGVALQGKVVWGLLRQHHPDISLDQVAGLLFGPASAQIGTAIAKLLTAAFPAAEPTPKKVKAARPPRPRGVSPTS